MEKSEDQKEYERTHGYELADGTFVEVAVTKMRREEWKVFLQIMKDTPLKLFQGRAFMTSEEARELGTTLLGLADRIDAGDWS